MSKQAKGLEQRLAKTPLFAQTTSKQRTSVARAGKVITWKEGEMGVKDGSKAAAFYMILEGSTVVEKNGTVVNKLRAGDFFGEVALLSGGARTANVTAAEDCTLFALGRPAFKAVIEADPLLSLALLKAMSQRLSAG